MLTRRQILGGMGAVGLSSVTFRRAIAALIQANSEITAEMVRTAAWIADAEFDDAQCDEIAKALQRDQESLAQLRAFSVPFDVAPACVTETLAPRTGSKPLIRSAAISQPASVPRPATAESLAFLPVTELATLIRTRQVTSLELTQLYLDRLKTYDPILKCVVHLTEDLALRQARQADLEIAAGRYRGWLHGIPWGAKDLIAVDGYPTTWGIPQFRDRILSESATVYRRLEEAGAVLIAKLSLGAIAMGDRWFGGMTRNPWNPRQGSSGSSAGSASAVAAGLVGFAIGSETLGSILSPSRRCGTSAIRPTYGRVGRGGCMSLSWSMDKLGPITRSIEDCALVFDAIHGADPADPAAYAAPFDWPQPIDWSQLRVGYSPNQEEIKDREDLAPFREMGARLIEVDLPKAIPIGYLTKLIDIEGASMFEEMLRRGETEGWNEWPSIFRSALLVPAVDYLRIQRMRRMLMSEMEQLMSSVDVLVNVSEIVQTNLTGHPSAVMPIGFRNRRGFEQPYSVVITGQLNGDDRLLAIAKGCQDRVQAHLRRPPLETWLTDPARFSEGDE